MNTNTDTQLAKASASTAIAAGGIQITTLKQLEDFANYVLKSPFKPKGFEDTGSIMVAIQLGMELGLPPLAALQNIAVINGRPSIYGDAALAVVRGSKLLELYEEEDIKDDKPDKCGVLVRVKRKGHPVAESVFTVGDAKRAGLWDKAGPWKQYPRRMLMFRARGFVLRDQFGDVLKGLATAEEVGDYPESVRAEKAKPAERVDFDLPEDPLPGRNRSEQATTEHTPTPREGELV